MSNIPTYFFFDKKLHRKRKIVKSANALVAWCYQDEEYVWLDLPFVRKNFHKAYTINEAAKLINTTSRRIKELISKNLVPIPEFSYDYLKGSYTAEKQFFDQSDLVDVRQAVWDSLRKNRFGEPYNDTVISEQELLHKIALGDDRQFIYKDDGTVMKIYSA